MYSWWKLVTLALVSFFLAEVAQAQIGLPLDVIFRDYARADPARPGVRVIDLDRGDIPVYARQPILAAPSVSASQVSSSLANQTGMSFEPQHGTQVSFATKDGKTYLWYPGNQVVVPGEWRIETRQVEVKLEGRVAKVREEPSVCYRYGSNTYNPATRQSGAWNCIPFVSRQTFFRETRQGDIFGLAGNTAPPFVLSRDRPPLRPSSAAQALAGEAQSGPTRTGSLHDRA